MAVPSETERLEAARASFRRLMMWTILAGVVMVVGALAFLSTRDEPLTGHMILATIAGVFIPVLLGAGLMAFGFFSSNSGHDDRATGHGSSEAE